MRFLRNFLFLFFLSFSFFVFGQTSQTICNTNGNLAIYSNYDGGILTINVDQNIPNLKIGICTYEPVQVNLTGAFVGNVTQVIYAGFNSIQNNNNCSQGNFITSITGVPPGLISIFTYPLVGYTPAHGNGAGPWGAIMIGVSGQCDTLTSAGGGNTPDEVVHYFQQQTGGTLLFHKTQYACWLNETVDISTGGNCCILPPNAPTGCNLNATVAVIQNTVCEPCSYTGPPILINELMISPTTGDGSISGSGGNGEWIELYNPDLCDSIDISCYYLGNSTAEGTGGFRLPSGTIIPPNGFAMIRGEYAAPVPSNLLLANGGNVVEIVVPLDVTGPGVCCSGTRVWFPNAGGWFAFYDASGTPIDAVSWGPGNTASLAGNPCLSNSNSCTVGSLLSSYNSIPSNLKFYASPAEGGNHLGSSIRRFPDGGNWQGVGGPTYATCNDPSNCLTGTTVGFCNGQGTVNVTSGLAPYSYQWNDDLNQTTQTATNLCEGSYQVIVSDANNCIDTVLVNVITSTFNLSTNIQQPGCQLSNGSISIDPFDPSYSYTWTPNISTTNVASNLAQGTYNILISQGFCFLDTTIILQNPVPFTTNIDVNQTTCGIDNGEIIITNSPLGNYSYNWSNSVSTTNSATDLAPGTYQISITDNICNLDTVILIQTSIGLSLTALVTNSTCEQNNGSIALGILPPSNYTFSWVPSVSNSSSGLNLPAGSYTISYTDGICSNDTLINIVTTPFNFSINIQQPSCQLSNGSISIVPFDPSYSYTWSPNISTTNVASNLAQGTYNILISQGFCFLDTTIILQNPVPFTTNINVNQTTCGIDNGEIIITNSPSGNYSYNWSNSVSTTNSATDLAAGTYQISITDNICSLDTIILIQTSIGLSSTALVTNSTCEQNNGSIALGILPPSNYTFSWIPSVSSSSSGLNLPAGSYTISYTDGICSNDTLINIVTTPIPSLIQSSYTNPYCGLENGAIVINGANGGTAPYSYSFNGLPVQEIDSILNIGVGTYPITVIDGNGCSYTQTSSFIMTSGISNIFIPNVLTANDDQANDLWKIQASCIDKMECQILNRWGNKIFEFNNLDSGWNGKTSDGFQVEEGVYFYKVTFDYFGDDKEEGVFHGHITVIR